MGNTDRVEILYAARLEGPGLTRWSPLQLAAVAFSRGSKSEVVAKAESTGYGGGRTVWQLAQSFKTQQEAVVNVKSLAAHPNSMFNEGRFLGEPTQQEATAECFASLKVTSLVDSAVDTVDLSANNVTIGLGQFLASAIETDKAISEKVAAAIERYFETAPFTFGYWAPFKRLYKLIEARPDAANLLGVALARLDGRLNRTPDTKVNDDLRPFFSYPSREVASVATVTYMVRRGRRALRKLGRQDSEIYTRCAKSFLLAADRQGSQTEMAMRRILADVLYGRGVADKSHGRGSLLLPKVPDRYNRRWDRCPGAWNQHLPDVGRIWTSASKNFDIQAWAYSILRSQRQDIPDLPSAGLRLALLSPSARVRARACEQVATEPRYFLELDDPSARAYLEFSSPKQFAAIYSTLESNAQAKIVQDAVFSFANEHGLLEIRRGTTPTSVSGRASKLLSYTLKFLRSRLSPPETFHLARYVGQTTKFKPIAEWKETIRALPLKTLVELRLQITKLSPSAIRVMDDACRVAAAQGAGDESLAAALTLSPASDLRTLGWQLLKGASSTTIATVWDLLIAHSGTQDGLQRLLESARRPDRMASIDGHPRAAELLAQIIVAIAGTDQKVAYALLRTLVAAGDAARILDTLDQLLARIPEGPWARQTSLLRKIVVGNEVVTQLIWKEIATGGLGHVARLLMGSKSLTEALVEAIDSSELITFNGAQARVLASALRTAPSRLIKNRQFAIATATCPHPEVHDAALAFLEARDQLKHLFVPLVESGLPAAVAASERYLRAIKSPAKLTTSIVAVCDSGVAQARALGLKLIKDCTTYDQNAVFTALAEHTAPEITAAVASHALAGGPIKCDALRQFDYRVLRTRRVGRKAKDLVKARLGQPPIETAVQIEDHLQNDGMRIKALIDLARSAFQRDREWALQELARLALAGHAIPDLQVSTTS